MFCELSTKYALSILTKSRNIDKKKFKSSINVIDNLVSSRIQNYIRKAVNYFNFTELFNIYKRVLSVLSRQL